MGEHKLPKRPIPLTNERQAQLAAQMMIFGRQLLADEEKRIQPDMPAMTNYAHAVRCIRAALDEHDKSFTPSRLADMTDVMGEAMPIGERSN